MGIHYFFSIIISFLVFFDLATFTIANAKSIRIIRDAETETVIRLLGAPIFQAARLNPKDVYIHIVQDNSLNAFVAGGQRIFINSGLIIRADNPGQLIGVIAHETGHISGGHLSRVRSAMERGSAATILSAVLGAAVTIGTGRGDLANAIISGGGRFARRSFMTFSRSQENSADQAALRFLEFTQQSALGLLQFMKILKNQELLLTSGRDPYVITHPLTAERINTIEAHLEQSEFTDKPVDPILSEKFFRIRAKLIGFIQKPSQTLAQYKEKADGIPAFYALAQAHYKNSEFDKALTLVDKLIELRPNDEYFHEFRGHVLFYSGKISEAISAYETAISFAPNEPLILFDLSRIQIESRDAALLDKAIVNLKRALLKERYNSSGWRLLGIAYARKGDKARSSLALAEAALLLGRVEEAKFHAKRVIHFFPKHSPEWLKGNDILEAIKTKKPKKKNRTNLAHPSHQ